MKIIFLCVLCVSIMLGEATLGKGKPLNNVNYKDRQFYSIGTLPENHQFVCIEGDKWLEKTEPDRIELIRMFIYDEELKQDIPMKCL